MTKPSTKPSTMAVADAPIPSTLGTCGRMEVDDPDDTEAVGLSTARLIAAAKRGEISSAEKAPPWTGLPLIRTFTGGRPKAAPQPQVLEFNGSSPVDLIDVCHWWVKHGITLPARAARLLPVDVRAKLEKAQSKVGLADREQIKVQVLFWEAMEWLAELSGPKFSLGGVPNQAALADELRTRLQKQRKADGGTLPKGFGDSSMKAELKAAREAHESFVSRP